MIKPHWALLLMSLMLSACGGVSETPNDGLAKGLLPTVTPSSTPTLTAPTASPTKTPAPTVTPTVSPTKTPSPTATPTVSPTKTPSPTATPTVSPTKTPSPTATPTVSPTKTPSPTATPTTSALPAVYAAQCAVCHGENGSGGLGGSLQNYTRTLTNMTTVIRQGKSFMPAYSAAVVTDADIALMHTFFSTKPMTTATATPSKTPTATATPTKTPAATATPIPSKTPAPTAVITSTPARTPTATPVTTPVTTPTKTPTASPVSTASPVPTASPTPTPKATPTRTPTPVPTATAVPTTPAIPTDEVPLARARVLSGIEYSNAIQSILGTPLADPLAHTDGTSGFSTGSGLVINDSLLSQFRLRGQAAANRYVNARMTTEFPCMANPNDACLNTFIKSFGLRVFRRPISSTEIIEINRGYQSLIALGLDAKLAKEKLVERFLMSPYFLYRSEIGSTGADIARMSAHDIATFIAFTLTGSTPSESLLTQASEGKLDTELGLRTAMKSLMATQASKDWLRLYFIEWLRVGDLEAMKSAPANYSKLGNDASATANAYYNELDAFIAEHVFAKKASLRQLFQETTYPIYNQLANVYELPTNGLTEKSLLPVNTDQRRGILTLASVQTVFGSSTDPNKEKPVGRAIMVMDKLLCKSVGLPSGLDITQAIAEAPKPANFNTLTVREQLDIVMQQNQACIACHSQFMPYGYLFSNYSALGKWRDTQNGRPINAAAVAYLDGEARPYQNAVEFIDALVDSPQFNGCASDYLTKFMMGDKTSANFDFMVKMAEQDFLANTPFLQVIENTLANRDIYLRGKQ